MTPLLDIEFSDLSYTTGRKKIIKCISGYFKGGELTAIMGPSGAGKSSLMNILVGYVTSGVSGQIRTNGEPRRMNVFNKLSSYIQQEDLLQPYLTVKESMTVSARLKLSHHIPDKEKLAAVDNILKTLGLMSCENTFTDKLSGGQRKRVAVALELVNNPHVIFLDEPTTGLDVVSINQTVELLKLLSEQGKTVICTIHQPSASLLDNFNQVYMLGKGRCIYQGPPRELVPFLSNLGYDCPETHNPADYAFEILHAELINRMSEEIQNGKLLRTSQGLVHQDLCRRDDMLPPSQLTDIGFSVPFWYQFLLIFNRMMLQKKRNKWGLYLQIIHHTFSALVIGSIFQDVGHDARRPYDNFKFVLCVGVFFMYTHCMTPILTYPMVLKVMKREFFNRWYSLKAYYLAVTMSTLPLITVLGVTFCVIVYTMADQPLEYKRFGWFIVTCILVAWTSEGLGILIGFLFNCTNGTVVGPSIMSPILMVAMHGMGYGLSIEPVMYVIMKLSYLRFALVSMITALYLDDRVLVCGESDDPYCYYRDATLVIRDLGMTGEQTITQIYGLLVYLILFRIIAFFALRYLVTTEFTNTILVYMIKIIKRK